MLLFQEDDLKWLSYQITRIFKITWSYHNSMFFFFKSHDKIQSLPATWFTSEKSTCSVWKASLSDKVPSNHWCAWVFKNTSSWTFKVQDWFFMDCLQMGVPLKAQFKHCAIFMSNSTYQIKFDIKCDFGGTFDMLHTWQALLHQVTLNDFCM